MEESTKRETTGQKRLITIKKGHIYMKPTHYYEIAIMSLVSNIPLPRVIAASIVLDAMEYDNPTPEGEAILDHIGEYLMDLRNVG